MNTEDFKTACENIKLLLFDCDGVLTDGKIILGSDGFELKTFSASDGMGIKLWRDAGFKCGVVTGRTSEALAKRAQELKFHEIHQGIANKHETLTKILDKYNLKPHEVAYVGDDINDLPIGSAVGLFFAPANRNPLIDAYVDKVMSSNGGNRVIRDVVELLLSNKGVLYSLIEQYTNSKNANKE